MRPRAVGVVWIGSGGVCGDVGPHLAVDHHRAIDVDVGDCPGVDRAADHSTDDRGPDFDDCPADTADTGDHDDGCEATADDSSDHDDVNVPEAGRTDALDQQCAQQEGPIRADPR